MKFCLALVCLLPALSFAALEHPRAFFTRDELPAVRAKAQLPEGQLICKTILDCKDFHSKTLLVDTIPPTYAEEYTRAKVDNDTGILATKILNLAGAYVITGEEKYLKTLRLYFKEIATWQTWYNPYAQPKSAQVDLYFGRLLGAVALAYDWTYTELPADERKAIRTALANSVDYGVEWLKGDRQTGWEKFAYNHWSLLEGGLGVAVLMLEGEDPRWDGWNKEIFSDRLMRIKYLFDNIKDGTYWEGKPYQGEYFSMTLPYLYLASRLKDPNILPKEYFYNLGMWYVYNYTYDSLNPLMLYSDVNPRKDWNMYADPLWRFSASLGNRYAEWLHQATYTCKHNRGRDNECLRCWETIFEFLFWDPKIKVLAPDDPSASLPLNRTFPDLEAVIWRTGWGANDLAFGLKTGPYKGGRFATERYRNKEYPFESCYNMNGHYHEDCGTFYINRGENVLVGEVAQYYATSSTFHNVVMVDDKELCSPGNVRYVADTDGRLQTVVNQTADFNFLSCDQTLCYRGWTRTMLVPDEKWLKQYKRYILFSRPDIFIVVDNITSAQPHKYNWYVHFAEAVADAPTNDAGGWVKAPSGDAAVGVKTLAPLGYGQTFGIHHCRNENQRYYLDVHPAGAVANTRFVNVLWPTRLADWDKKPDVTLVENSGKGVLVRIATKTPGAATVQEHLVKCVADPSVVIGNYELAGEAASVSRDEKGGLLSIFIVKGNRLSDGKTTLISSADKALSLEAKFVEHGLVISAEDDDIKGAKIYGPSVNPQQVTRNGKSVSARKDGEYLVLP